MAISVNEKLSDIGDVQGTVIIDSDLPPDRGDLAYTELRGPECRRMALMFAAKKGLHSPGVNGNVATYPVDKAGREVENPTKSKIARFRAEVPVTRRIV